MNLSERFRTIGQQPSRIYEINPYEHLVDVLTRLPECETDEDFEKWVHEEWVKDDGGL